MEDYVTYEQAKKLREVGFCEETRCGYYKMPKGNPQMTKWDICLEASLDYASFEYYKAPTLSQVQKWLREVKGIILHLEPRFYKGKKPLMGYDYHLSNKDNGMYSHIESETIYDTYEEALSVGIDKAIEILKE